MITIQSIDNVLYEVANEEIAPRRKSFIIPVVMFVTGVVLAIWSIRADIFAERATLSSALMMLGVVTAMIGLVKIGMVFSSKGIMPIDKNTGERLNRYELYFDQKDKNKICHMLAIGSFQELSKVSRADSSNLMLTLYCTKSGSIALAQVSEYIPHNFEPITEVFKFNDFQGQFLVASFG